MVYPTFLIAVADPVHPQEMAESIGVFRSWWDGGYAVGAIITGIIAGAYDLSAAIYLNGVVTFVTEMKTALKMNKLY
jgi:hypothetical protein